MEDLGVSKLEGILLSSPTIECDCGNTVFEEGVVFKKVSKIVSPSGKDEVVPISVYTCKKCGKVLSAMFKSEYNCRKSVGDKVEITAYPSSNAAKADDKGSLII